MHSNRIHRPNVVTRRATAKLTDAVPCYREVRPNKNNNNDDIKSTITPRGSGGIFPAEYCTSSDN